MWNNNNKFERLANIYTGMEVHTQEEHKNINNIDEKFATQDVSIPMLDLLGNDSIYIYVKMIPQHIIKSNKLMRYSISLN